MDQDVSKIRGVLKSNFGLVGNIDRVSGSDWRVWKELLLEV